MRQIEIICVIDYSFCRTLRFWGFPIAIASYKQGVGFIGLA